MVSLFHGDLVPAVSQRYFFSFSFFAIFFSCKGQEICSSIFWSSKCIAEKMRVFSPQSWLRTVITTFTTWERNLSSFQNIETSAVLAKYS